MYCCCHLQKILFPDLKMHPSFKPARSGTRRSLALVSFPSCHPASLKAACKLVAGNGFLISAANLIMVTLGNGSMRSQVIALNFSIKGQVPLIFNPLTAAAASHLVLPRVSPPRSRQEPADLTSARLGFASGIFLGGKKRGRAASAPPQRLVWGSADPCRGAGLPPHCAYAAGETCGEELASQPSPVFLDLGTSCGFRCQYFGAISFSSLLKCMCFSSFKMIICIKKLMITIPGLLFPNKDDSSDINHYVADCKIATFRHIFILGLDFLAGTIYERETVGNFLL